MITYSEAVLIDLAILGMVIGLLIRHGRLSHSHPATIYLFFHIYSFSWRLYALSNGATPLFAGPHWGPMVEPLREEELVRAALLADGVLILMTLAWLLASRRHAGPLQAARWYREPINTRITNAVTAVALPVGLLGLAFFARIPGIDNASNASALGEWSRSSYILIVQSWAGLMLVALVYVRGPRWWLLAMVGPYLSLMAYQGFHRYRAIIPSILLIQIYLDRRSMRWPNFRMTAALLAIALAFFPLKNIGRALQEGSSLSHLLEVAATSVTDAVSGEHADQLFLDELASGLSLIDRAEVCFYGTPYLAVLTLPIPRQLWPEKPTLNDFWKHMDVPSRPMFRSGMILTFIGDLYANFSYVGLFVVAPLLAFLLARVHFATTAMRYGTIGHFAYLLVACNLLQIYRDGLVSLVIFIVVNMLPLTIIVLLHYTGFFLRRTIPRGSRS